MLRGVRGLIFGQFIEDMGHDTAAPNVVDLHLGIEAKGQGNFLDIAAGPTDDERDGCTRLDALIQPDEIERFRSVQCIFLSIFVYYGTFIWPWSEAGVLIAAFCRRDFFAMQGWWLPAAFLCAAVASAAAEYFGLFLRAH